MTVYSSIIELNQIIELLNLFQTELLNDESLNLNPLRQETVLDLNILIH